MNPLPRVALVALALATTAACSSGGDAQAVDLRKTPCSDWAGVGVPAQKLSAQALIVTLRTAAKSPNAGQVTDDQVTSLVSEIGDRCSSASPGTLTSSIGAAAIIDRSEFYLG